MTVDRPRTYRTGSLLTKISFIRFFGKVLQGHANNDSNVPYQFQNH